MNTPTSKSTLRLLLEYLPSRHRLVLAELANIPLPHLYQVADGTRLPSAQLAVDISRATRAMSTRMSGYSRVVSVREIANIPPLVSESSNA